MALRLEFNIEQFFHARCAQDAKTQRVFLVSIASLCDSYILITPPLARDRARYRNDHSAQDTEEL